MRFAHHPEAFLVALWLATALPAQGVEKPSCDKPIEFESEGGSQIDFRSGKTVLHEVKISQCDVSVTAQRAEATGLDFKNSRWVFSGDVHVQAAQRGNLRSDRADVEFRANRIAKATITGKPAEFEQRTESEGLARGRAGEIVYDVAADTVVFSGDAWLSYAGKEMKSPQITYNIREQQAQGRSVHLTIEPKSGEESKDPSTSSPSPKSGKGKTQ